MFLQQANFTKENHHVRTCMYARQRDLLHSTWCVSQYILEWLERANMSTDHIPYVHTLSKRLQTTTWRQLCTAENAYLSNQERFTHLKNKEFPVTDYIRPLKDIDYTPLPDLFHEYFGHMPQMFQQEFADIEHKTALLHFKSTTKEQQQRLFNISWRTIEYWILFENWQTRAVGAWVLSSPWDLKSFYKNEFHLVDATLEKLMHTPPSPHAKHETLFVCQSLDHRHALLDEFTKKYL